MKTLIFKVLIVCLPAIANAESWNCTETVVDRSGTIDISRCSRPPTHPIACYQDIRETCQSERGRVEERNYRRFTGECVQTYGECW